MKDRNGLPADLRGALLLMMVALLQVVECYKDTVVHIVADKPWEDAADQIKKAIA